MSWCHIDWEITVHFNAHFFSIRMTLYQLYFLTICLINDLYSSLNFFMKRRRRSFLLLLVNHKSYFTIEILFNWVVYWMKNSKPWNTRSSKEMMMKIHTENAIIHFKAKNHQPCLLSTSFLLLFAIFRTIFLALVRLSTFKEGIIEMKSNKRAARSFRKEKFH